MNDYELSVIQKAKDYSKSILMNDATGHDYFHVMRVLNTAIEISKHYQVNLFIIQLASILHDLDDYKISNQTNHVKEFLNQYQVPEKAIIMDIIEKMSYSAYKAGKRVESLEAKIIQDADRLDALGAIGIARVFAYSGHSNRTIYRGEKDDDSAIAHFYDKLLKLPNLMNTDIAKELANERVNFMKEYLKQFYLEWSVVDERV